jgi:hypothetical protein
MSPNGKLTYDQLRRWPAGTPIVERHHQTDGAASLLDGGKAELRATGRSREPANTSGDCSASSWNPG